MSEKDNPAERLYRHLYKARRTKGKTVKQMLSEVLNIPADPPDEFVDAAIQFYRLFDEVITRLRRVEDIDEEIFIKPIESLRGAIPLTSLESGWDHYLPKLNDADLRSLKHAIHEINRQPLPPKIEQSVLDKLQADVTALYNLVDEAGAAEVPEALRKAMLVGLWEILIAIKQYNPSGAAPLHHALLLNVGTYATYYPLFEQHKENKEVSKYKEMIDRLRKTVPWAADVSELIGAMTAIGQALLPGGG